jgi:hypothetical protein
VLGDLVYPARPVRCKIYLRATFALLKYFLHGIEVLRRFSAESEGLCLVD